MKMMEILRILYSKNEILGAKIISSELEKRGYSLGERAVRYHMHILDEKGFTEKVGYKGRKITDAGINELKTGLIFDQVDFTFSRFQEKMYNVSLNPITAKGSVIVNVSSINDLDSINIINKVFDEGLAVSRDCNIIKKENKTYIETVCGTTIDGVFQKNGIITKPLYGGLLKIEDYVPINFTEQIAYENASITPLDAFTNHNTSVWDVINEGTGVMPANFRIIPATKKEKAISLLKQLKKIGIDGVIHIGDSGQSVLGIPVPNEMIGITVVGGVTPLCAAQEYGYDLDIKLADNYAEYQNMIKATPIENFPLKPVLNQKNVPVSFVLNKIYNLLSQVTFDVESGNGDVIVNVSYIDKENIDDAIEIINNLYKLKPQYCIGNRYALMESSDNKVGIATICSLTIGGILTKNGISSSPEYSGLLDIYGNNRRFIELISYQGSSVDPHEIFINKNMCNIEGSYDDNGKILASVHSVPYIAREETVNILNSLKEYGLEVLNIGKPNEYIYNAKIDKYHFGYVVAGGLNPITAIKEHGIPADVKSIEVIKDFNTFEVL